MKNVLNIIKILVIVNMMKHLKEKYHFKQVIPKNHGFFEEKSLCSNNNLTNLKDVSLE